MKNERNKVLETDQLELAKSLNFVCLFGVLNNEYLLESLAKHFPDTFKELESEVSNDEVEELVDSDPIGDSKERKRTLDRMMYRIVINSINICIRESFSNWAQRDSFAGWKICCLRNELLNLATNLAPPIFGSEYVEGAHLIENVGFASDHDFDYAKIRKQFDTEGFQDIAAWLNFMAKKKNKYELPKFDIDSVVKGICSGKKKFRDIARALEMEDPTPSKLKRILHLENKMGPVLKAVTEQQGKVVSKIAEEMGVGRDTVRRWANEYEIDLGANSGDDDS